MSEPRGQHRLAASVVLLGLTSLFTDVGGEMIFPLLPVFLTETLHANPAYLGLVEGVADTVASLLKLASGVIADRLPARKPLVLFGYGIASAARPLVALASQPWHVLAVRVTDRVGKGVRGSPRDAMIADASGEHAGRAFGFNQAMDHTGAVVGPLLATALLHLHVPMRRVFLLAIVPGAFATLLVALVREPLRVVAPVRQQAASPARETPPLSPSIARYLAILALFSLGNSSDVFLLLQARAVGLTTAQIPILWAVLNASKVLWAYLGGNAADRLPRARVIACGWGVFALVYLGLGHASAPWQVWTLFIVYGVFYGLTEPVEKALVKDLAPADQRGRAYGAYNSVIGLTSLPAGLLTGTVWRLFGARPALEVGAVLASVAMVLLLFWEKTVARPSDRSDTA